MSLKIATWRTALGAVIVGALLGACEPSSPPVGDGADTLVDGFANVLVTTGDGSKLLSAEPRVPFSAESAAADVRVEIDRASRYQSVIGVGAAMTDSSASVLTERLAPDIRAQVIHDLFTRRGANLSVIRVPLSSTDFSTDDHTYDDIEPPGTDPDLAAFSLARDDLQRIPLLRDAAAVNPDLSLIGSPWSAPGWMKSGASADRNGLIGGTLAPDMVPVYARYLRRVVAEFAERGLPLDLLTIQNEPSFAPGDYAGMLLSPDQEAELAVAVGSELRSAGFDTGILVHDHNWSKATRALEVLGNADAEPYVSGSAFHCYGGEPSAQAAVHDAFPSKDIYFTECSGTESSGTFESNLLWNTRVLLIDSTRNWSRSVVLWNLALDESSGPRVGGCRDCRGLLTIHGDGHVTRNEEFYALAQFGRGVDAGATRIGSSSAEGGVSNVVLANPDGTTAAVLASTAFDPVTVELRDGDRSIVLTMPPRSVVTVRWR